MLYYHFTVTDKFELSKETIIQEANRIVQEELKLRDMDCDYDFFVTKIVEKGSEKIYFLTALFV